MDESLRYGKNKIRPHHQQVIHKLIDRFKNNPDYLALIIGGSVAKGTAKDDSDVDIILVATDQVYQEFEKENKLNYFTEDICDYKGGYVDGKIVDIQFLKDVAQKGSEPARAAFVDAIIAFSKIPEIYELIHHIPTYPQKDLIEKLKSFRAQVEVQNWYVGEAEKRNDKYLLTRTVADLILYGGRLILAYNKKLYPYHKHFLLELEKAENKPKDLMKLIHNLLNTPNKQNADAFTKAILEYTNWPIVEEGAPTRFMKEVEWAWRNNSAPLCDK